MIEGLSNCNVKVVIALFFCKPIAKKRFFGDISCWRRRVLAKINKGAGGEADAEGLFSIHLREVNLKTAHYGRTGDETVEGVGAGVSD